MQNPLLITRPLIGLDLETTGTDTLKDKIVQISLVIIDAGQTVAEAVSHTFFVNPGISIPAGAIKIHQITDEMVADQPLFSELAPQILALLEGVDIVTFNGNTFDIPLLKREFQEAGIDWDLAEAGGHSVDVRQVFMKMAPRSLAAAVETYLGIEHTGAHDAEVDTRRTLEVLFAMLRFHGDKLPGTVPELEKFTEIQGKVDIAGKFFKDEAGDYCFNFGPKRGNKCKDDLGFLNWMLTPGKDFHPDTIKWVQKIKRSLEPELLPTF